MTLIIFEGDLISERNIHWAIRLFPAIYNAYPSTGNDSKTKGRRDAMLATSVDYSIQAGQYLIGGGFGPLTSL